MSHIGKNIKKIRSIKKLSQSAFAELFNLSRTSVGSYEEERAEPKIETIIQIANYFGVSVDLLLQKELTVNDLYQFDIFKIEIEGEKKQIKVPDIELKKGNLMKLVSGKNSLEYIIHYKEKSFLKNLPEINIPLKLNVTTRAFEIVGNEMEINQTGLKNGDIVICHPVSVDKKEKLIENELYIIVYEDKIIARRLKSRSKQLLTFITDNNSYQAIEMKIDEIKELWKISAFFSTHLPKALKMNDRLSVLESKMEEIIKKMNS